MSGRLIGMQMRKSLVSAVNFPDFSVQKKFTIPTRAMIMQCDPTYASANKLLCISELNFGIQFSDTVCDHCAIFIVCHRMVMPLQLLYDVANFLPAGLWQSIDDGIWCEFMNFDPKFRPIQYNHLPEFVAAKQQYSIIQIIMCTFWNYLKINAFSLLLKIKMVVKRRLLVAISLN